MSVKRIVQTGILSTMMVLGTGTAALANNGPNGHHHHWHHGWCDYVLGGGWHHHHGLLTSLLDWLL